MASPDRRGNWLSKLVKKSSPDAVVQSAHVRRREQVRRAQRTHRERKDQYLKSLESEVAKLREKDAAYDFQSREDKESIRRLLELLVSHGIAVPSDLLPPPSIPPLATIRMSDQGDGTPTVAAVMPHTSTLLVRERSKVAVPFANSGHKSQGSPSVAGEQSSTMSSQMQASSGYSAWNTSLEEELLDVDDIHAAQIAVDFVLSLERPCLIHHLPATPGFTGHGHFYQLQSPIMARCPRQDTSTTTGTSRSLTMETTWGVPVVELQKLLNLSERLSLDGDITPIEAWQRIRRHAGFSKLTQTKLESLRAVLAAEVACYGFGAVIDEVHFELKLEETFRDEPRAAQ